MPAGASALLVLAAALAGSPAVASSALGPSEYVSKGGSDTGTCAKKAPCKTINHAISLAVPGEKINVAKGIYNKTVKVNKAVTILGAVLNRHQRCG